MHTLAILTLATTLAVGHQTSGIADPPASVTFTLDFPNSNPKHYSLIVRASGHTRYDSTGAVVDDSEVQTYTKEFEMSSANRERIFALARRAKYFVGKVDSGNKRLAFTGAKTLIYDGGGRSNKASYNYSNLEPVRELTELFQKIETTLEYGRQLTYSHRYQKLALAEELKRLEALAKNDELAEIQSIAPVLKEIVDDSSVINVVRVRAQELIEIGERAH